MNLQTLAKAALPALAILLTACDEMGFDAAYKDDFHYSYPLSSGGHLSLEGFNGAIEIRGWDQDTVQIDGTKYAGTPDRLNQLKISIDAQPSSIRIRAEHPIARGNSGANFTLRVPRRAVLDRITTSNGEIRIEDLDGESHVRTSNGQVNVRGVKGDVDAETSNGGVEIAETSGNVLVHTSNGRIHADLNGGSFEGNTSNGSIQASFHNVDPRRQIVARTSNGGIDLALDKMSDLRADSSNASITLHLPSNTNARLRASTSNASISTDFPVTSRGDLSKNHLEGDIGSGGPLLDLTTSNGGIRIVHN